MTQKKRQKAQVMRPYHVSYERQGEAALALFIEGFSMMEIGWMLRQKDYLIETSIRSAWRRKRP